MAEIIEGPQWEARNWSIDAGEGSIHDDATASSLGFRGGTVAGDVHMNQFVPVLLQVFGFRWFEQGNLSLTFRNATVDMETVQVFAEKPGAGIRQTRVWMERDDGMLVCEGTAAMGDHSTSALRVRDLRPCDPAELKVLARVTPGMSLGSYDVRVTPDRQFELFDALLISDPLDFYRTGSHWGDVIACPSTIVQQLWGIPMAGLRPHLGDVVGLFGAIEVGQVSGPMVLNRDYHLESEVICVGQSPKTEYLWFDTTAYVPGGDPVATMRMMLRFMKSSSRLYDADPA
ncbi:MAG: hypothetical protein O2780_05610 [Proteobacteria bacterium]|nr:hypothetical protein [Pseudomonadota bacterium]MDA1300100.1 hypothetical protein [Pseudomonadota bacterium]